MPGIRDLQIGRIRLPTITDDIKESIGDKFDVVGASVVPGEPEARPFTFSTPIYGEAADGVSQDLIADRIRRQLRSLIDNPIAGRLPLYMQFDVDHELDGWLLIGAADLEYDSGGAWFSEYKLTLTDAYKVANRRSHYQGVQITNNDLRLGTFPRDFLRTVYSTDFATLAIVGSPVVGIPGGTKYFTNTGRPMRSFPTNYNIVGAQPVPIITTQDFNFGALSGYGDGMFMAWEDAPTADALSLLTGEVLVLDRRGLPAPIFTAAGDADQQGVYGWEEVYGPNYPLTPNDAPVLSNGRCRVQWVAATQALTIETITLPNLRFEEVARVNFPVDPFNGGTASQNVMTSGGAAGFAKVVAYTPYSATICITLTGNENPVGSVALDDGERLDVYVTLRHGWEGPKIECYRHTRSATSGRRAGMRIALNQTGGAVKFGTSLGLSSTLAVGGATVTSFSTGGMENGFWLNSPTVELIGAVLRTAVTVRTKAAGAAQDGYAASAAHVAVDFHSTTVPDVNGNSYLGLHLAGPRNPAALVVAASGAYTAFGRNALNDVSLAPVLVSR